MDIQLDHRPFALTPTFMMMPDGIFVKSLFGGMALMRAKLPNPGYSPTSSLTDIFVFHSAEAEQILIENHELPQFKVIKRSQRYIDWTFQVNIAQANVGKHALRIRMNTGVLVPLIALPAQPLDYTAQIYIADADFDVSLLEGNVVVPQGSMRSKITGIRLFQKESIKGRIPCDNKAIFLPDRFSHRITFAAPFSGVHGPIPFEDPWWKVGGWVVAIVAGVIAGVWLLGGILGFWESPIEHTEGTTTDPDTGEVCRGCTPSEGTVVQADPIWGAFLAAAAAGATVGYSDLIDPFRRGEVQSVPDPDDKSVSETLDTRLEYKDFPLPGTRHKIGLDWSFVRHGEARPDYPPVAARDDVENIHYVRGYTVRTADGLVDYERSSTETVAIEVDLRHLQDDARFAEELKRRIRTTLPEFYVSGLLRHRATRKVKATPFYEERTRVFRGAFTINSNDPLGEWDLLAIIQNVNNAPRDAPPAEQAQVLGGFVYSKNFVLQHDPVSGMCSITPNRDLTVRLT